MSELDPYSLLAGLADLKDKSLPPLHLWHPDQIKDIDMEIREDGSWYHEGDRIARQRLAHLFSTVLRRESDGEYYLVTPVEKCRIRVQDAPFIAVTMDIQGSGKDTNMTFTTNMADTVIAGPDHPLRFEVDEQGSPIPYVMVRNGLEARANRSVYYQLMQLLVPAESPEGELWGIWSGGEFFSFRLPVES
ncbi:MAG: DUF1285 domain-containing protein [Pseudomonadales bacterium]|nr:DUF1285 domain-containing protein [Pseudomonadales bacterium]